MNAITVLSSFVLDPATGKYEPIDPVLNSVSETGYSAYIPLGGMVGATTTVQTVLPGAPAMTPAVVLVGCIGIEFYQDVNAQYYLLGAGNAMRIQGVY